MLFESRLGDLPALDEAGHHVEAQDVGLPLLDRGVVLLQRLPDRAPPVHRVLDAEPVGHLVEHGVGEERVERHVLALVLGDQHVGDRHQDLVELGAHAVLQLEPAGALLQLHDLVVGQVDRDRLRSGVRPTRVVHRVVGVEVGVASRHLPLVGLRHREAALERGQQRRKPGEPIAPLPVLDQHDRLEARLVVVQPVLVHLDRPDHDVDGVVLHVHPRHVAGAVVVGQQRLGAELEVALEARVLGELRRRRELLRRDGDLLHKRLAIRDRAERAVLRAPHEGVQAPQRVGHALRGIQRGLELGLGDIRRIHVGPCGFRADPVEERGVAVQPVPRTVVDLEIAARRRVGHAGQELLLVAVGLHPEGGVHLLGRLDEERNHPTLALGQLIEVGREPDRRVLIHQTLHVARHLHVRGAACERQRRGDQEAGTQGVCSPSHVVSPEGWAAPRESRGRPGA